MALKKLKIDMGDLLLAMERSQDFEIDCFLDTQTGEVITIQSEHMMEDGDGEDLDDDEMEDGEGSLEDSDTAAGHEEPDWIKKDRELAKRVAERGDRYQTIDPFDGHEAYRLMEDFIGSVDDDKLRDGLWRAIKGKGAFRYFKDTLGDHNLLDRWYAYEHERKLGWAREWLESIGIKPE